MITIYIYVLDTLADWELGHVMSELHSGRFFKKDAPQICLKTVGITKNAIKTMGGIIIMPDCTVEDMVTDKENMLLLPGADTWNEQIHNRILEKADEFLSCDAAVCAICGATTALANWGILNQRPHTSNGAGFLEMFCPNYKGQSFYVDQPAVADNNLITGAATGALLFAKEIIAYLDVFKPETLEAWYQYFSTGKPEHFFALMGTLDKNAESPC